MTRGHAWLIAIVAIALLEWIAAPPRADCGQSVPAIEGRRKLRKCHAVAPSQSGKNKTGTEGIASQRKTQVSGRWIRGDKSIKARLAPHSPGGRSMLR
jgi:hypothetical protein